jgi:hypothetical protein
MSAAISASEYERADCAETTLGARGIAGTGWSGPCGGERRRDRSLVTDALDVAGEAAQLPLDGFGGEAESAAERQEPLDAVEHGGRRHGVTPGQGPATARSDGRSTLA